MLDRVLDEGLNEKRRQAHAERVRCCVDRHAELRAEARLLELEVAVHVPQLLFQRDELARTRETTAQVIGEREHEPASSFRLGADERRDRVEGVEDEVRLHLRLQRRRRRSVELRQLKLRGQMAAHLFERLHRRLVERRAGCGVGDDRADRAVVKAQGARGVLALGANAERREQRCVTRGRLVHRADRPVACAVMVGAGTDEREYLVPVRDGDRSVAELLEQLVGDAARGALSQPMAKLGQCCVEKLERGNAAPAPHGSSRT